ncbi:MAG: response regulator [Anaerolineae bacterium]|jgi:CheY-like chemotaxis protein
MAERCVLAIERNWQMRKLIRANLEPLGLEVREAVTEKHGLERLGEGQPDLILLDLDLPNSEGWHLLDTFEERFDRQPVPVVLMSAEPPGREVMRNRTVVGHLLKPFGVLALLEQVRSLLDTRRAPS